MRPVTVFFRDDDMGGVTGPLLAVMRLLRELGVPCNYQVVPAYLSEEVAALARAERAKAPDLVHFNQHGLRHKQVIGGREEFSEFDGGRGLDDQRRDIEAGRRVLERMLGADFDGRIFTPPCHKYDEATLRALEDVGVEVLSAGVRTGRGARCYYRVGGLLRRVAFLGKRVSYHGRRIPRTTLVEVSACIDVDMHYGAEVERGLDDLWREFEHCRTRLDVVGVMLHHACYTRESKVVTLRRFVERLQADPGVTFRSIQDVAAAAAAS